MNFNNSLSAIIVEDEQPSLEHLQELLAKYFPEINIVDRKDTVSAAVAAINQYLPDIIFLDISIKDGTGFDVLGQIGNTSSQVIFTTAFDQYAIDAFQYSAVDYLLKPLQSDRLVNAVNRCIRKIGSGILNEEVTRLLQYMKQPERQHRIPVSTMYGLEFIHADEILFVEADGNYAKMKLKSGRNIMLSKKIKEIEDHLPPSIFMRVHNSYIVNIQCVKKYHKGRGGHIILDDESSIPVSPSRKDNFLKLFQDKL